MHDTALVRVVYGGADSTEQFQPFGYRQLSDVTVLVNGKTIHVLHDNVRQAILGATAVKEPGDVGMIEVCENLALTLETAEEIFAAERALNQLDGSLLLVVSI